MIFLTPTVANLIDPRDVPSLETIILGGEATTTEDFARWRHLKRVLNGYGPTECTVFCLMNSTEENYNLRGRIGRAVGSVSWIANPEDPTKLLPIGAVGELLIEGHGLAKGYLNDAERTSRSFIDGPRWLTRAGRSGRLYRTGDLARYDAHGGVIYLGRADTQVKIRGQRVELKEIELQLSATLPQAQQVVAEILSEPGEEAKAILASFVVSTAAAHERTEVISSFENTPDTDEQLARRLPSYMIPSTWLFISQLPLTTSGKTDRQKLRKMGSAYLKLHPESLKTSLKTQKRAPETEHGKLLRQLWGDVLGLAAAGIGLDDDFFRLGGDSIAAMKLASSARKAGIKISVAQIFKSPGLQDLAEFLRLSAASRFDETSEKIEVLAPFALLGKAANIDQYRQEAADICGVTSDAIEDMYPCTPIQEGLVSQTIKNAGDYVLQNVMELKDDVDISLYRQSWECTVSANPILRTRIIQHSNHGLLQVVIREKINWREASHLQEYLTSDKAEGMDLGSPLARYALVHSDSDRKSWFVWTIQHSIYDGGFLTLMKIQTEMAYLKKPLASLPPPKFSSFVKHILDLNKDGAALGFWKKELAGFDSPAFPPLPSADHHAVADALVERTCMSLPRNLESGVTVADALRASWALAVNRQTGVDDVVFGMTFSGRNVQIDRIEELVGPTIATVPVRVRIPQDSTVSDYLATVRDQSAAMMPYEQTGMHQIATISPDSQRACNFQTLLVVQPAEGGYESHGESQLGTWQNNIKTREFTTYAITIVCQLGKSGGFKIGCAFDPRVVAMWRMERILDHFVATTRRLLEAQPHVTLVAISELPQADLEDIWAWNDKVPMAVERPIHNVIRDRMSRQPESLAVDAWDGKMTYGELLATSRLIATHLQSLGVEKGSIVPLAFEKSMWAIVAMMAVLQASAIFVPLDPTQASGRRERVLEQTDAKLIITSEIYSELEIGNRMSALSVGPKLLASLQQDITMMGTDNETADEVDPSSGAYVIFTSGSTGQPKGVLVSHCAISSSTYYHGSFIGLRTSARFLQFAAYTFDASIAEILTTLTFGGCVCVPSQDELLGDLAGAIQAFSVNVALLTPSVTRTLRPSAVPTLKTLLLGGEAVLQSDIECWTPTVETVINLYGPTECAVICCGGRLEKAQVANELTAGQLGKAIGSATWIVDPNNGDKLMPVGAVGELVIEGPILAQCYIGDTERTDASFVQDPAWLANRRSGRVYKTGDLVRYCRDGSLSYIGRKDNQAKIRGQRLEVAEVEFHVQACMTNTRQLVVEVITIGDAPNPVLAAFAVAVAVPREANHIVTDDFGTRLVQATADIEESLSTKLPSYMIPTLWFSMDRIPLNASGKSDRRRLRELGANCYLAAVLSGQHDEKRPSKAVPTTEDERLLQSAWARVLNINSLTIGLDDSFLRLGGDSITAMQVSSALRASSLHIPVATILKKKTIRRILEALMIQQIATSVDPAAYSSAIIARDNAMPGELFELSPIQQVFFGHQLNPHVQFDQCFFLRVSLPLSHHELLQALDVIVATHSMLRSRFLKDSNGSWQQYILPESRNSYSMQFAGDLNDGGVLSAIANCRASLDIESGPLFAGVVIDKASEQNLFLAVHHLVIDLVSWRVILQDLENLLTTKTDGIPATLPSPLMPFSTWCKLQGVYAKSIAQCDNMRFEDIEAPLLSYWGVEAAGDELQKTTSYSFTLSSDTTLALFGKCNDAYRTRPMELMIACLLHAFDQTFTDRPLPTIWNEGHGREVWDDSLDLSRTCGWFTTLVPVQISGIKQQSLQEFIRRVKDYIRSIPQNGWSYFVSRFVNKDSCDKFISNLPVEIMFNYSGGYGQLERGDSLFENITAPASRDLQTEMASTFRRHAVFDVLAGVQRGQLAINFVFPQTIASRMNIERWIARYQSTLESLASESVISERSSGEKNISRLTLSDFPGLFGSYEAIDEFHTNVLPALGIDSIDDIEHIYPAASTQEGILISQAKDPKSYHSRLHIVVSSNERGPPIDVKRLQDAWRSVSRRHDLLRAVFIREFPGNSRIMQAILANPKLSIHVHKNATDLDVTRLMHTQLSPHYQQSGLQHHLDMLLVDERKANLILEINHAIIDGYSTNIIARDLKSAYEHVDVSLTPSVSSYGDFVMFLDGQSREEGLEFWAASLAGTKPCHFPGFPTPFATTGNAALNDEQKQRDQDESTTVKVPLLDTNLIRQFCQALEITPATVVQLAWAVVLRCLMMVLASGGCVCVPSEEDRKNSLTEAIVSFGVNTIDVTPSICRLLNPNDMPLVHTMILGGEQLRATDIAHWPGHVKILNCYGPSECTPTSTINDIQGTSFITGIGKAAGAVTWIVDPIDHNVLAPPASHLGREGCLYKTGDLVRYQSDGNLTYIGRKDTQVKLRGQRVELEDVEHHALASVPGAKEVVVEVITPSAGKTDRRKLREIGSSYSMVQLNEQRIGNTGDKRIPTTDVERTLQSLWSHTLGVQLGHIGLDDNFFHVTIGLAIDLPSLADSSVTMATIIRAAWAQAIHHNTGSSDIVFGATLSGRNAPIAGIEDIIGPTIATVPVRIKVPQRPAQSTVLQFLLDVQAKSTAMIPHEQFGLHKISKITP
ncbi:hypothetical protein ACHAP6_008640 [Verticillium nonalfalfae]